MVKTKHKARAARCGVIMPTSQLLVVCSMAMATCNVSVLDHGALGDGVHDDSAAFQAALDTAAPTGGCVWVPPVRLGAGYVITGGVTVPYGVSLVGAVGPPTAAWPYGPPGDFNNTGGSRILARPETVSTPGAVAQPLFSIAAYSTIRGLLVDYDRMPYPTDDQLRDNRSSPFFYPSFARAAEHFYTDHLPVIGPTFYVAGGKGVTFEDVEGVCYMDFIYMQQAGITNLRRVRGWGYGTLVAVVLAEDVVTVDTLSFSHGTTERTAGSYNPADCVPGATGAGSERCRGNFTWLPAIVAASPRNVGVWLGRADGYQASNLFFFAVNTALRLGYSADAPMINPITRTAETGLPLASGPWGAVAGLMVWVPGVEDHVHPLPSNSPCAPCSNRP